MIFTVYGSPVAQPRTHARAVMSKDGKMFAHVYEPGKKDSPARQWKSDIRQEAVKHRPLAPWGGAVSLQITFYLNRPGRLMKKKNPDGPLPHTKKPDRDNLEKAVMDALKGIFFVDDCQVCAGEVKKFYHEKNAGPRAVITIQPIPDTVSQTATS